jgi:hypothetical protein
MPAAVVLSDTPVREARELLDQLPSAHLLNQPRADRYQFHDLLRVYAAERAELEHSEPEREASLRRLLDWYLRAVAEANNWVRPDLLTEDVVLPEPSGPEVSFRSRRHDRLVRRRAGHPRGARIRCGAAWLVLSNSRGCSAPSLPSVTTRMSGSARPRRWFGPRGRRVSCWACNTRRTIWARPICGEGDAKRHWPRWKRRGRCRSKPAAAW